MIIKIKNNQSGRESILELGREDIKVLEGPDEDLVVLVDKIKSEGVLYSKGIREDNELIIVEDRAVLRSKVFPYAVKKYLARNGYIVTEIHPEVESEIKSIINNLPDDNLDKQEILNSLSSMSYLEQTLLLKRLKIKK